MKDERLPANLSVRFWSKVLIGDGCWEWSASFFPNGYGQFQTSAGPRGAHRVAWQLTHGPIPDGLHVCHRCDNPRCVRPSHLFLGTHRQNHVDKVRKGRSPRGERNGRAKLTQAKADDIRRLYPCGFTQAELARRFGVSTSTVSDVLLNKKWLRDSSHNKTRNAHGQEER